jgi:protein-S-isoprenylcysteine O-methyltransferase Ste14
MTNQRVDWGRVALIPMFVLLALLNASQAVSQAGEQPFLATAGTIAALLFYVALATQYLRRGPASQTDRRPLVWVVASVGTFAPFFVPLVPSPTPSEVASVVGSVLIVIGLSGSIWSVMALGRNISVVPQARQVATEGPYRWFRHPLYAFELVAGLGFCLVSGGGWAYAVWIGNVALLVLRATWEEQLLSAALTGYDEYASRTPGLALPASWRRSVERAGA